MLTHASADGGDTALCGRVASMGCMGVTPSYVRKGNESAAWAVNCTLCLKALETIQDAASRYLGTEIR